MITPTCTVAEAKAAPGVSNNDVSPGSLDHGDQGRAGRSRARAATWSPSLPSLAAVAVVDEPPPSEVRRNGSSPMTTTYSGCYNGHRTSR